jgi:hypothetical protein
VQEAKRGGGVGLVLRVDARHAVRVDVDRDRSGEAGDRRRQVATRQGQPDQPGHRRRREQQQRADGTHHPTDPADHHAASVPAMRAGLQPCR